MADRTIRAIFEARVSGAQKGMRDLSKDVEGTGKKVDGLSKDLKDIDKLKVKPTIDVAIDKAQKEVDDLKKEIDRLDALEATPEVLLDFSKALIQLGAAEKELKKLNGAKAKMTVTADTSQAEDALDDLGDAGDDAGEGIVSGILDALKSIPIAGAVVGVGAAIGGGLLLGIAQGFDIEAERDLFSARSGLDEKTSARFGRAAGEAYANAWGDSIAANLETARLAMQAGIIDASATDAEIENVIAKLSGISDLFQYDIAESVRGVGNLMKSGLVKDANQAFDLIVAASRKVQSDDLIDTLNEYSTQFKTLGLTGEQAFGLIAQGAEAGARDTDNIADSLKEMGLRIREGLEPAQVALEDLGLNATDIIDAFQKGGPGAVAAMDKVFDALRELEEEGGNTQAVIAALFGGPGEDLGAALYALDLDTVAEALGGVEGAAGAADEALATMSANTAAKMETAKRNVQLAMDGIKGALAEAFADDIGGVSDWITKNRAPLLEFFVSVVNGTIDMAEGFAEFGATALETIGEIADGMATLVDSIPEFLLPNAEEIADGLRAAGDGARDAAETIRSEVPDALDEVRDKVNTWVAPEILKARIHDATVAMTEDMEFFAASIEKGKYTVTINGDTVNAEEALKVLTDNINEEDGTVTINGDRVPAEDALDVLLGHIAAGEEDVTVGANTTPAELERQRLLGRISATKGSVKVDANTKSAERKLADLERTRYVDFIVRVSGRISDRGLTGGVHEGGWIGKGLNDGGWVPGSDPGYDNILWPLNAGGRTLMQPLAGGEFVMNSTDSAYWGPLLEWMNGGGRPVQTFNETNSAPVNIYGGHFGPTIDDLERRAAAKRRRDALSPSRRG